MTQTVQMPDGSVHEFPDEATPEMISSALGLGAEQPEGIDAGAINSAIYGFGESVPFGSKIQDYIGATGAKSYDVLSGEGVTSGQSISDLAEQSRLNTKATEEASPIANIGGNLAGFASLLPVASSKIPTALANFARRSEIAGTGAATSLANLLLRSGKGAALAAPAGALYGAGNAEPGQMLEGAKSGGEFAAAVGAGVPLASAAVGKAAQAVIPEIEGNIAALAQKAVDFGIPLRVDQINPTRVRNTVQKVSQEIPFSGVEGFEQKQKQLWNKAVAKTIGQDSEDLGPQTIKNFLSDAGKKFSSAIGDVNVTFGQKDLNRFGDIVEQAKNEITGDKVAIVKNNINKFLEDSGFKFGKGRELNSKKLASLRSDIIRKLPSIEGDARPQVAKIVDVIDDVAERYMTPEQASVLQQARREWRNYKTLDPLLEKATDGTINPTELMNRVASSKYIDASKMAIGEDDLVDLARIGKQFMPKKGGSDTFQKSAMMLGTGGALTGLVTAPAQTLGALAVAGTGMVANRGLQKVNTSQALIKRAIQQSVNPDVMKKLQKYVKPGILSSAAVQLEKQE